MAYFLQLLQPQAAPSPGTCPVLGTAVSRGLGQDGERSQSTLAGLLGTGAAPPGAGTASEPRARSLQALGSAVLSGPQEQQWWARAAQQSGAGSQEGKWSGRGGVELDVLTRGPHPSSATWSPRSGSVTPTGPLCQSTPFPPPQPQPLSWDRLGDNKEGKGVPKPLSPPGPTSRAWVICAATATHRDSVPCSHLALADRNSYNLVREAGKGIISASGEDYISVRLSGRPH